LNFILCLKYNTDTQQASKTLQHFVNLFQKDLVLSFVTGRQKSTNIS